mgnify:CR=1 FL=1
MPIYLSFSFWVCYLILELIPAVRLRKVLVTVSLLGLLSGSFWVYPKTVAQGWDSTLAHLPYYGLRQEMIEFIEKEEIPKESIGYDFPGAYPQNFLDLSNETWFFPEADFEKHRFVLYSNVINDYSDSELNDLEQNWKVYHQINSVTVELILYQNPKF